MTTLMHPTHSLGLDVNSHKVDSMVYKSMIGSKLAHESDVECKGQNPSSTSITKELPI